MDKNQERQSVLYSLAFALFGLLIFGVTFSLQSDFLAKNATFPYLLFYWFTVVSIVAATGYIYFHSDTLKHETQFIILFSVYGGFFLIILPIWLNGDAFYHWYRILDISQGHLFSAINNDYMECGQWLPENSTPGFKTYGYLNSDGYARFWEDIKLHLNYDKLEWVQFPGSALYSPITYLFQLPGVFLAMLFTDRPFFISFAARFSAFLFSCLFLYVAVKKIPTRKKTFILLVLTPTFIQGATSPSGDAVINTIAFTIVAFALYYSSDAIKRLTNKDLMIIALLAIPAAMAKIVYLPLIAFFLIIPKSKFSSSKVYYLFWVSLFGVAATLNIFWSLEVQKFLYVAYKSNASYLQIQQILQHPLKALVDVLSVFYEYVPLYFEEFWGISVGFYLNHIVIGDIIFLYAYSIILLLFFESDGGVFSKQRLLFGAISLIIAYLSVESLIVQWAPDITGIMVGEMVQGRYFIPVSLALAVCVPSVKGIQNIKQYESLIYKSSLLIIASIYVIAFGKIMLSLV